MVYSDMKEEVVEVEPDKSPDSPFKKKKANTVCMKVAPDLTQP